MSIFKWYGVDNGEFRFRKAPALDVGVGIPGEKLPTVIEKNGITYFTWEQDKQKFADAVASFDDVATSSGDVNFALFIYNLISWEAFK